MVDLCREKLVYLVMIPGELGARTFGNRALAQEADHRLAVLPERPRELHGGYGLVLCVADSPGNFRVASCRLGDGSRFVKAL